MGSGDIKCVFWGSSDQKVPYHTLEGMLNEERRVETNGFVIEKTGVIGDQFITVSRADGTPEFRATRVWHLFSPNEYRFERWVGSSSDESGWVVTPLGTWISTLNFIEPQLESFATLFEREVTHCPDSTL